MSSRRTLLCSFAALTMVPAAVRPVAARAWRPREAPQLAAVLAGILPRLESAAAAGRRIRERGLVGPCELAVFAQNLLAEARRDPAGAARHVEAARRRDFATGEVLAVDGWVVARTEARLCALVAASSGSVGSGMVGSGAALSGATGIGA